MMREFGFVWRVPKLIEINGKVLPFETYFEISYNLPKTPYSVQK